MYVGTAWLLLVLCRSVSSVFCVSTSIFSSRFTSEWDNDWWWHKWHHLVHGGLWWVGYPYFTWEECGCKESFFLHRLSRPSHSIQKACKQNSCWQGEGSSRKGEAWCNHHGKLFQEHALPWALRGQCRLGWPSGLKAKAANLPPEKYFCVLEFAGISQQHIKVWRWTLAFTREVSAWLYWYMVWCRMHVHDVYLHCCMHRSSRVS